MFAEFPLVLQRKKMWRKHNHTVTSLNQNIANENAIVIWNMKSTGFDQWKTFDLLNETCQEKRIIGDVEVLTFIGNDNDILKECQMAIIRGNRIAGLFKSEYSNGHWFVNVFIFTKKCKLFILSFVYNSV